MYAANYAYFIADRGVQTTTSNASHPGQHNMINRPGVPIAFMGFGDTKNLMES